MWNRFLLHLPLAGQFSPKISHPASTQPRPKGDPFSCSISARGPEPQPDPEPSDLDLNQLPEALQSLITRAITRGIAIDIQEHHLTSLISDKGLYRRGDSSSASLMGSPQRSPQRLLSRSKSTADLFLDEEVQRDDVEGASLILQHLQASFLRDYSSPYCIRPRSLQDSWNLIWLLTPQLPHLEPAADSSPNL